MSYNIQVKSMENMKRILCLLLLFLTAVTGSCQADGQIGLTITREYILDNNLFNLYDLYDYGQIDQKSNLFNQDQLPGTEGIELEDNFKLDFSHKEIILLSVGENYKMGYVSQREKETESVPETVMYFLDYDQTQYNLKYHSLSQALHGLYLSREFDSPFNDSYFFNLKFKLLQGQELVQNHYDGKIIRKGDKSYLTAFSDGIDSNLNNISQILDEEYKSYGFSLGFDLKKEIRNDMTIIFKGDDLLNLIYWDNVYSYTSEYSNSSMGWYDNTKPSYSTGNYFYNDYYTNLSPEYDLQARYDNYQIGLFYKYNLTPYIRYLINLTGGEVTVGFHGKAWSLAVDYSGLSFSDLRFTVKSDRFNPLEAETFMGNLKFSLNF